MMESITVWTKQHENVLKVLNETGIYLVQKKYIISKMEDFSDLYFDVYNWYCSNFEKFVPRPVDAYYPIWVSVTPDTIIKNDKKCVILELEVNKKDLYLINIDKWDHVVNYLYIAKDLNDQIVHDKLLKDYGIDDTEAYMSNYYPSIKRKIIKSWECLFGEKQTIDSKKIGTLWQIKKEWIKKIEY